MENQMDNQIATPNQPARNSHNVLFIIFTFFITALLIGGVVYYYQQSKVSQAQKAVQELASKTTAEIDGLKAEIKNLEDELSVINVVQDDTLDGQIYTNVWDRNYQGSEGQLEIDFTFEYPSHLKVTGENLYRFLRQNNTDSRWLVRISTEPGDAFARYKQDTNNPNAYLDDYLVNKVMSSCAADGVKGSIYCKEALIVEKGKTVNGVGYYRIHMTEVSKYADNNWKEEERSRGPVYALDINDQSNGKYSFMFLSPEDEGIEYEDIGGILKGLLDSIKFN